MEKFLKISFVFAFVLCTFIAAVLCACSNVSKDGTAAIVNGTKIAEDEVSQKITEYRTQYNLLDDEAWQKHLKDNNTNSKKVRDTYLDKLIDLELYRQIAAEKGISAADDDTMVALVNRAFVREAATPKEAYSKLLLTYGEKLNGSKGYYQLMFKNSDEAHAREVLSQIKAGTLSFQDAIAKQMAVDDEHVNFDYVIYDCMIINPDPCPSVLATMHPGQISDLIKTQNHIYIFNVVDEISCEVPLTSLSSLSDFTQENLRFYAKFMDGKNVSDEAFAKVKKQANITKYDTPEGLPY